MTRVGEVIIRNVFQQLLQYSKLMSPKLVCGNVIKFWLLEIKKAFSNCNILIEVRWLS